MLQNTKENFGGIIVKRFLSGFLAGAIIFSMIGVFAVSYVANPVDFKVLVNGKEFVSDPPALEVNGSTYLPLRAIGNALGVPVNWNEELRQAEVGNSASVAETSQYSRTNPAPLNTVQIFVQSEEDYGDSACSVSVRVLETIRGDIAWEKIKNDNRYNNPAPDGYEYIIAKIATSVISTKIDRSIEIDSFKFDCFSGNNEEYDAVYISLEDELSETLYAGGNGEGYLVFCVKKEDKSPKIAFCRNYDGTGGIWFNLQ